MEIITHFIPDRDIGDAEDRQAQLAQQGESHEVNKVEGKGVLTV